MRIAMIAAMDRNGVIGIDGKIPWHLPADLLRFRELTMGKPVIMGRKTLESIGKPLDGRHNIVLTRQQSYTFPGVCVAHYLGEAIRIAEASFPEEAMVIGGSEIYRQFYDMADRIYLTVVDKHFRWEGSATFPHIGGHTWSVSKSIRVDANAENPYRSEFCVLNRIRKLARSTS